MYICMGMRATVIHYSINVRTPKKEKGRTKIEQEQIWNGFKMFQESVGDGEGDLGGTVAGSAVDAEMSVAKAGTDDVGAFPSSDFIV